MQAEFLAKKDGAERETAFQLLSALNPNNFAVIQLVFKKPTPHNEIRYSEIKSLFGSQVEGKIPGSISSVSGSHRKICIQNVVGFFDKTHLDKEKEVREIVGGTFQAHKKEQGGKLPRIAIELICSTLERAGITAKNLELFTAAKQTVAATGETKANWQQLLDIAMEKATEQHKKTAAAMS